MAVVASNCESCWRDQSELVKCIIDIVLDPPQTSWLYSLLLEEHFCPT